MTVSICTFKFSVGKSAGPSTILRTSVVYHHGEPDNMVDGPLYLHILRQAILTLTYASAENVNFEIRPLRQGL